MSTETIKSLVVCYSYHHSNTEKVAKRIASVLGGKLKTVPEVDVAEFQDYDLIGFGAGIDSGHHYDRILELARSLPVVEKRKAFIFSTSGVSSKKKMVKDHKALREILVAKGYVIVDEFNCHGLDTVSFLKYFGGLNKGRPNESDLANAEEFSHELLRKYRM